MKIIAITDIHGNYKKAEEIILYEKPDILIIGGDLTNVGSIKEAELAIQKFQKYTAEMLSIAGNMDLPGHDTLFDQHGISINGNGKIINGIGFFGVSGAPLSPLNTPYEIEEKSVSEILIKGFKKIKDTKIKILVSHAPPYGTELDVIHSGRHVGSTAVKNFIEAHDINVLICGHIHEARGKCLFNNIQMINCGEGSKGFYALLRIEDEIEIQNMELK